MSSNPNRFVWFELVAGDRDRARRFYTEVLPWTVEEVAMGGGEPYPMIKAGEVPVGGFATPPKAGIPPHWVGYLAVADVAATAKKALSAGGESLMDAFDIPEVGRAQPLADPQGGVLFSFRAAGADQSPAEGAGSFHWNELWADDPAAAVAYYKKAFGFASETMDMPTGAYHLLKAGDVPVAGIMKKPDPGVSPHWLPYVHVDDVDAAVKRARAHGGELLGELTDVPGVGRIAIIRDPLGARLGLITPAS